MRFSECRSPWVEEPSSTRELRSRPFQNNKGALRVWHSRAINHERKITRMPGKFDVRMRRKTQVMREREEGWHLET